MDIAIYFGSGYANDLIFMNINENFKNERKILEKLKGIRTKLPMACLSCVLVYIIDAKSMLRHCTVSLMSDMKKITNFNENSRKILINCGKIKG